MLIYTWFYYKSSIEYFQEKLSEVHSLGMP